MKYCTVGMLAHVDAGKTTFSEHLLYHGGAIRTIGRVDHADTFLDDHPLEKQRGITIFSAQANIRTEDCVLQIVDTPGHADFSGEMERAVSVLDCAVLLLSCAEGIQAHTRTVWKLLEKYRVPVLLFLNKTDRAGADSGRLLRQLKSDFSLDMADLRAWPDMDACIEEIAAHDDALLERYLEGNADPAAALASLAESFRGRRIFPVLCGSALQDTGVKETLELLTRLASGLCAPAERTKEPFRARVYKVRADHAAGRLAYLKVLSGTLAPRDVMADTNEKVTALYSVQGTKLTNLERAEPGMLCAAVGLSAACGTVIGADTATDARELIPMLVSSAEIISGGTPSQLLNALKVLEDEDPLLETEWQERTKTVQVRVMGTVQLETMREVLLSRFGMDVRFGKCRVRYLETVRSAAEGVGHYEPLRHYAEVRVRLEPLPRGGGIRFESRCHVDFLNAHWQRQIGEILLKREHRGVLTGSALTDVKIVLMNGRAHLKHTEGGDFYEAASRAVRCALMNAESVLLEPLCRFRLEAPFAQYETLVRECLRIHADMDMLEKGESSCVLAGTATLDLFVALAGELPSLTRGQGSAQWESIGYTECADAAAVTEAFGYDPMADVENTPNSVFCAKGAGFTVHWEHVEEWAHTSHTAAYGDASGKDPE